MLPSIKQTRPLTGCIEEMKKTNNVSLLKSIANTSQNNSMKTYKVQAPVYKLQLQICIIKAIINWIFFQWI